MALLDEVAAYLIAGNIASSSGSGTGWYLYRGRLPDSTTLVDRAVAILETGGEPQLPNVSIDRPSFDVVVRGANIMEVSSAYHETWTKARAARDRLHFVVAQTLSGVEYAGIRATDELAFRGLDMRQRPVFAGSFTAWRAA